MFYLTEQTFIRIIFENLFYIIETNLIERCYISKIFKF